MLSGKRVHVWTGGSGPALLLIHSAWGDAEMSWIRVWNDLSKSFTVIAPDMPGFGASEPLTEPSLSANAGVLKDLLDAQKVDSAVVVGNSFGVAISIEFASCFPERARHLVLMNGGYMPAVPAFMRRLMTLPALEKSFRSLMRRMTYSDKAFAKAFPNPADLPPGFLDRIRQNEEKQSRIVFDAAIRQTKPQVPPSVPATIVWGTGDGLAGMRQAGILRKWLGGAKFVAIDGAGHMPQMEKPAEFVEAMKRLGES